MIRRKVAEPVTLEGLKLAAWRATQDAMNARADLDRCELTQAVLRMKLDEALARSIAAQAALHEAEEVRRAL
jgi:hypothetical protein